MDYLHYKWPQDILDDSNLSTQDKIKLLQDWAADENEKLTAEEENMALNNGRDDDEGELLSKIEQALSTLRNK